MRKLTDSDKQTILKLYRETGETTSTLADHYGVSNSTISRLLKSTLPEDEYEHLVSLKRAARTTSGEAKLAAQQATPSPTVTEPKPAPVIPVPVTVVSPPQPKLDPKTPTPASRRVRKRSSVSEEMEPPAAEQLELLDLADAPVASIGSALVEDMASEANVLVQMLGEDLLDEGEDLADLDDEDEDDDDFDDDEDDDEEEDEAPRLVRRRISPETLVQVLPFSAASLPRTCYLVIDRASELITRPLKDFGDLGQIPMPETQQRTLPIFDNHRVAKRFSTKRDRVIKVPDSRMLHKARYHLQAKGITRLLIDGQVYSLAPV